MSGQEVNSAKPEATKAEQPTTTGKGLHTLDPDLFRVEPGEMKYSLLLVPIGRPPPGEVDRQLGQLAEEVDPLHQPLGGDRAARGEAFSGVAGLGHCWSFTLLRFLSKSFSAVFLYCLPASGSTNKP